MVSLITHSSNSTANLDMDSPSRNIRRSSRLMGRPHISHNRSTANHNIHNSRSIHSNMDNHIRSRVRWAINHSQ